jgi:hypothetical protein
MVRRAFVLLPFLAIGLAVALGACAPPGSRGPSPDLVTLIGHVTASPTCPVERAPPASACAARTVRGAVISIRDAHGREVASVVSAADGSFVTALPPGGYQLVPAEVSGILGTAPAVTVDLAAGTTQVSVEIRYDTGIR